VGRAICKLLRRRREGEIHIGLRRVLHCLRQHADHRILALVQFDLPVYDRGIAREVPLPEAIIQHRYRIASRMALILAIHASQCSLRTQHRKEIRRRQLRIHEGRIAGTRQAHIRTCPHRHLFKRTALPLPILVIRKCYCSIDPASRLLGNRHDVIHLWHRQRVQHYRIHAAESRRIHADAQCQRDHHRNRESR
jgi:hypothetical protein